MEQITHFQSDDITESVDSCTLNFEETINAVKDRLKQSPNLILPLDQSLDLLEQLSQFELGRFLLVNRGLNGYWTSHITLPSLSQKDSWHPLEEWFLTKAPSTLSKQERFRIFQRQTQKHLKPHMTIASIPCGLMDDLFSLDYKGLESVEIVGIDIDPESLQQAQDNSYRYDVKNKVTFLQKDAWELDINNKFDLITSSGLNTYVSDTKRVIDLYRNFYNALRPGGLLLISCSSPPPPHPQSTWQCYNSQDLLTQKAILFDILQAKWTNYRTEEQMREHLTQVGFNQIEVIYDTQKILLTFIARKL